MDWWYWFGMWVAAISGALLTWWVLIDSWRGRAVRTDLWPIATMLGMALQLPALVLAEAVRNSEAGTVFAFAGVAGIVLVGVSAIAHFSGEHGSSRSLERMSGRLEPTPSASTRGTRSVDRVPLGSPRPTKTAGPSMAETEVRAPAFDGSATILDTDGAPTMLAEPSEVPVDAAQTVLTERTIVEDGATLLEESQGVG